MKRKRELKQKQGKAQARGKTFPKGLYGDKRVNSSTAQPMKFFFQNS